MSAVVQHKNTFSGENATGEIETLDEFLLEVANKDPKEMDFSNWTFTDIDFSDDRVKKDAWMQYNFSKAVFYGCTLPSFDSLERLQGQGALFLRVVPGLPFKTYRGFMYNQKELIANDAEIYKFFLEKNDIHSRLLMEMHDLFIQDALLDYIEGKSIVAIMGGHAISRNSSGYRDVAHTARKLAREGFVVASGGGPGAMEASNLGAYMFDNTEDELNEALEILATVIDPKVKHEYEDRLAPTQVVEKFGYPENQPSLSIPTWKYGHEPTNMFGTWIAKLFSNAIREDGLLAIANAGIIYTPGSAGTRQEIFQAACGNHYAKEGEESPTIFYGKTFWEESGIPQVLKNCSKGRPFANWITEEDSPDAMVAYLVKFRDQYKLPVVTKEMLAEKFWLRPAIRALDSAQDLNAKPSASKESGRLADSVPARLGKVIKNISLARMKLLNHLKSRATDCDASWMNVCSSDAAPDAKRVKLA